MLPLTPPPPTLCFPGLHPHPTTAAPGVFTTWNNRGLGWGALRQGRGAQGRSPLEGSPKTTQHQREKLQIRQNWGHHSKVLIYRRRKTSGEGVPRWDQAGACEQVGQPRSGAGRRGLHSTLTPIPTPPLVTTALQRAPGGGASISLEHSQGVSPPVYPAARLHCPGQP